jgi:hypothetical protein
VEPDQVLGHHGTIQAELDPELVVGLLGEVVPEQHEDRIARDHPHKGEDDHRDREEHDQGLSQP